MGCPFVSCEHVLLPMVNKDTALAYGKADYSKVGNQSRNRGGKKVETGRCHVTAKGERIENLTDKPLMTIHRLIEMVYFKM